MKKYSKKLKLGKRAVHGVHASGYPCFGHPHPSLPADKKAPRGALERLIIQLVGGANGQVA